MATLLTTALPFVAIVLFFAIAVAYQGMQDPWPAYESNTSTNESTVQEIIEPCPADWQGVAFDYACTENVLTYRVCLEGRVQAVEEDCSKTQTVCTIERGGGECVGMQAGNASETTSQANGGQSDVQVVAWNGSQSFVVKEYMPPVCGDTVCEEGEDCASCPSDCACAAGNLCHAYLRACLSASKCGNGVCDSGESRVCCTDCGCTHGVCIPDSQKCVSLPVSTKQSLTHIGAQYVNASEYVLEEIHSGVHQGTPVFFLTFACTKNAAFEGMVYPCETILVVDATGQVIEQMHSQ